MHWVCKCMVGFFLTIKLAVGKHSALKDATATWMKHLEVNNLISLDLNLLDQKLADILVKELNANWIKVNN